MSTKQYTPHDDVNAILKLLLNKVKVFWANNSLECIYTARLPAATLTPKAATLILSLSPKTFCQMKRFQSSKICTNEIWSSGLKWAAKLEGAYVPKDLIRRHDPNGHPCPTVNEGQFYVGHLGSDWIIQRHVIREYGVVLEGPDPKLLIDPVSPDEIRQSVLGVLEEWWFPMLDNPNWLSDRGSEYHAYAVLTMCRSLHALKHGTIVSKPTAAKWAQMAFREWSPLIEKALIAQHGKTDGFLDEALDFIRFTQNKIHP